MHISQWPASSLGAHLPTLVCRAEQRRRLRRRRERQARKAQLQDSARRAAGCAQVEHQGHRAHAPSYAAITVKGGVGAPRAGGAQSKRMDIDKQGGRHGGASATSSGSEGSGSEAMETCSSTSEGEAEAEGAHASWVVSSPAGASARKRARCSIEGALGGHLSPASSAAAIRWVGACVGA